MNEFIYKCLTFNEKNGETQLKKEINLIGFLECARAPFKKELFEEMWESGEKNLKIGACLLRRYKGDSLPQKYLEILVPAIDIEIGRMVLKNAYEKGTDLFRLFPPDLYSKYYTHELISEYIHSAPISTNLVNDYLFGRRGCTAWCHKVAGAIAASMPELREGVTYVPLLKYLRSDNYSDVRDTAIEALRTFNLKHSQIEHCYLDSFDQIERISWMKIAKGRADVLLEINPDRMSENELPNILGLTIDPEVAINWTSSDREKAASIYWGMGSPGQHKNDEDYIDKILDGTEEASDVLKIAAISQNKDWGRAPYRSFEPPTAVYQKCLGGVIVEAEVLPDAEVREKDGYCRASKVLITDIIGDVFGEDFAISKDSSHRIYEVGDIVDFSYDFDIELDVIGRNGFKFFKTLDEAKKSLL